MIHGDQRGGTLGPTIWFFCLCLFYLLPVVVMFKYIGYWAWIAGTGFWALVLFGYVGVVKIKEKHDKRNV